MCGIVGYIGSKKAEPILFNGLLTLEYRGYDSAGISTIEKNEIKIVKTKGRVKNLHDTDEINALNGTVGIAHTRWATHGKPSNENSHPHLDNSKTFSVVHNGIIENYNELRIFLKDNGYTFYSQTDTEVIPNLIHYYFSKGNDFLHSVNLAYKDLKGSFAISVLCKNEPEKIIATRKDSPLVIGKGDNEFFISSDIPAYLSSTKNFYFLNDYDIAVISKKDIEFYDSTLNKITKETKPVEWSAEAADKNGYEDYMLKEIFEQPRAIRETIGTCFQNDKTQIDGLELTKNYLKNINKIFIVACGTAMHAGLATKKLFEEFCKISTEVDLASEFRYRNPLVDEKTLCIYISQSGETADTIAALKLAKSKGAKTIAVSNVIGSSITREADYTIYTHAGPEIAVASTKAYTSQVALLSILAIYLTETLEIENSNISNLKSELLQIPAKIEKTLECIEEIKNIANNIYNKKDVFFIGRGIDYAVALEGSLKLKEISYIHSEAYASGELKHGPIALIEEGTPLISILTDKNLVEKSISNIQEVITRGANSFVVSNFTFEKNNFDKLITIPEISEYISPLISVIPLQLLAYYISKNKGLDVDKPRNLAKSVTVE